MRYYDINNESYVSVTTLLSLTADKSFLTEWRNKIGHEEADKITRESANRGTHLHSKIEKYFKKEEFIADEWFYNIKPYLSHISPVLQEEVVYSHSLKLAGRVDCIGYYKDTLSIIDFKSARRPKKEEWITDYFLQTAFYSLCYEEMTKTKVSSLVILISSPEGGQEFIASRGAYLDLCASRYKLYRSKLNS